MALRKPIQMITNVNMGGYIKKAEYLVIHFIKTTKELKSALFFDCLLLGTNFIVKVVYRATEQIEKAIDDSVGSHVLFVTGSNIYGIPSFSNG